MRAIRSAIRPSIRSSFGLDIVDKLRAIITSLFSNGEQGAIYIPRPVVNGVQALFQDSAGTVPVTADGDPVGKMIDQSGNGNDIPQSISASRPIYVFGDDGVNSLESEGVDDYLRTDNFGLSQPCTLVTAFIARETNAFIFDGLRANRGSLVVLATAGNRMRGYAGSALLSSQPVVFDEWNIATVVFNGTDSVIRLNGVEVQGDAGNEDMDGLTLFASGNISGNRPQNNAGIIVTNDRMSSEEIINTENYLASIVGVTL